VGFGAKSPFSITGVRVGRGAFAVYAEGGGHAADAELDVAALVVEGGGDAGSTRAEAGGCAEGGDVADSAAGFACLRVGERFAAIGHFGVAPKASQEIAIGAIAAAGLAEDGGLRAGSAKADPGGIAGEIEVARPAELARGGADAVEARVMGEAIAGEGARAARVRIRPARAAERAERAMARAAHALGGVDARLSVGVQALRRDARGRQGLVDAPKWDREEDVAIERRVRLEARGHRIRRPPGPRRIEQGLAIESITSAACRRVAEGGRDRGL